MGTFVDEKNGNKRKKERRIVLQINPDGNTNNERVSAQTIICNQEMETKSKEFQHNQTQKRKT